MIKVETGSFQLLLPAISAIKRGYIPILPLARRLLSGIRRAWMTPTTFTAMSAVHTSK